MQLDAHTREWYMALLIEHISTIESESNSIAAKSAHNLHSTSDKHDSGEHSCTGAPGEQAGNTSALSNRKCQSATQRKAMYMPAIAEQMSQNEIVMTATAAIVAAQEALPPEYLAAQLYVRICKVVAYSLGLITYGSHYIHVSITSRVSKLTRL